MRVLIFMALICMVIIGTVFYRRQNKNPTLGGKIAGPKMLWLGYAVYVYYVLPPILLFGPNLAQPFRNILGSFWGFMLLRGLVELWLMYRVKRWSPKFGIAHNIASIGLIIAASIHFRHEIDTLPANTLLWDLYLPALIVFCLALDTYYAFRFHQLVGKGTTGDKSIWFASSSDKRFEGVLKLTQRMNVILLALLAVFMWQHLSGK